jgi:hypothetical protein
VAASYSLGLAGVAPALVWTRGSAEGWLSALRPDFLDGLETNALWFQMVDGVAGLSRRVGQNDATSLTRLPIT